MGKTQGIYGEYTNMVWESPQVIMGNTPSYDWYTRPVYKLLFVLAEIDISCHDVGTLNFPHTKNDYCNSS